MLVGDAKVGAPAVPFELPAMVQDGSTELVQLARFRGSWLVLLFYPIGLAGMCPTELRRFSALGPGFAKRNCQLVGIGVGSSEIHRQWVTTAACDGGLGPVQFPLATDVAGEVSRAYGVGAEAPRASGRGLFIVSPDGVLQYAVVHRARVCRSAEETLRVLEALQHAGPCAPSFTLGDGTIDPAEGLAAGRVLGHYRILSKIGEGGFGQVFQAWDLWLHRMVAIKVARPGRKLDLERVVAEARPAAALSHPNVCTVYAVEVHEGLPVIAMECLHGETLSVRLRRGPLELGEVATIVRQIAVALGTAHAQRIVHGDVKPGNVILCDDGAAKVLDFGLGYCSPRLPGPRARSWLASRTRPPSGGSAPSAGAAVASPDAPWSSAGDARGRPSQAPVFRGTPQYMSPEHGRDRPVLPASDVFSLGLVIYELLTGKRAISIRKVEHAIRIVRRTDLRQLARELPQPFCGIVYGCLAPRPEDRLSMATVVALLESFEAELDRG